MTTEQPKPVLDDLSRVQEVDKRNMLRLINELPEQCETALGIGRSFKIEPMSTKPNAIFITGIGDSGIAGDMVAAILSDELDIPIVSDHSGQVPKYVGEETLVLVIDYTGKSQTTLRSYKEAVARGAMVICVAGGGKLLETASKDDVRVVKILSGQPARSAIGYLFVSLAAVMEQCGLVTGLIDKLSSAIKLMKNAREALRFDNSAARNIAKQTAQTLAGKLAIIYSAEGFQSIVAKRWKNQINANSKAMAFANSFPDAAESEISGWEQAEKLCGNIGFVFIKDPSDKTEIADLMDISKELLGKFDIAEIKLKGATSIEKMLYGLYVGDYVSYYLALLYEVNPSVTESIAFIESRIAEQEITE